MQGYLRKMQYEQAAPLKIYLNLGDAKICLNDYLGRTIKLHHNGEIRCCNCDAKTKKSYGGGYCYRCVMQLAECDMCILKPETCHRAEGSCRNNVWSDQNCMRSHLVYLAYTSDIKVGITRSSTGLPRWYDQGAVCAVPLLHVPDRLAAGMAEVYLKQKFNDKSEWKKMLAFGDCDKNCLEALQKAQDQAREFLYPWIIEHQFDKLVKGVEPQVFNYPRIANIEPVLNRLSFSKQDEIAGKLLGVKGQYLLLDIGVVNIRQHTGYHVTLS